MDFIIIISVVAAFIFLIACLRLFVARIPSKGVRGERHIAAQLSNLPDNYCTFNDVYLHLQEKSIQIDHVVISEYGIFVIETKNYDGHISGSDNAKNWMQNLYGYKHKFYNPLWQNNSHVNAICQTLHVSQSCIIPVVVFINRCHLHYNGTGKVLYSSQLIGFILNNTKILFQKDTVHNLCELLQKAIISDEERQKKHIQSVQQSLLEKDQLIKQGICPLCKGKLVERNGKYGKFLGCSNYPYCRFTYNIDNKR